MNCEACKELHERKPDKAEYTIFVQRIDIPDCNPYIANVCGGCLKRKMLLAVRNLTGDCEVKVKKFEEV
jgi:hypothetical protein